jgi:DNA primase
MFLDFEEIKKTNPIDRVAERLGLKLTKRGSQLRGVCPSGEGGDRALVITPEKGAWYSFAKQTGGDVIALVSFVRGISPKEAAQFLAGNTEPEKKPSTPEPERGFKALEYLEPNHEAVLALGFDPADAQKLGVGYAPRGVLRGTVAVPVRLADGTLAGYIGLIDAKLPPKWSI